ncbi:MAG: DUF4105 domain-containing protein, partial [Pseudomonadales bacterium]|nr:DUF4105 domain-containing protein [Pseudomonadales bacterium]
MGSLIILLCVLWASTLSASALEISDQKINSLGQHPVWLDLLHFKPGYVRSTLESQADDRRFFLAETGHLDAAAEMRAFIDGMIRETRTGDSDKSVVCRFPARFAWLRQQVPSLARYQHECPALREWKAQLNADQATLIFPAAYLNSPSSMYGHTLLRLDQAPHAGYKPLLAYSINFAANADPADNELVFSWKGLTGGYPTLLSVIPYYEKVKEYSNMENRDVWEFKLNLSAEELERMVNHLWELREIAFNYYFFDENCAYRILALFDVARPGLDSALDFRYWAIPADTVRALQEKGVIVSAEFRPSDATRLQANLKQLSSNQQNLVYELATEPEVPESPDVLSKRLTGLEASEQKKLLEAAYQFTRYRAIKAVPEAQAKLARRSLKILSRRSKLQPGSAFEGVDAPDVRDDQGHSTFRAQLMYGFDEHDYFQIASRFAYHDLLDPVSGYIRGAQIEMGELALRWHSQSVQLQSLRLIEIQSFTPRNDFIQRWSWRVSTGLHREFRSLEPELGAYLDVSFGYSFNDWTGI